MGSQEGLEIRTFLILFKETSLLWGSMTPRFPQGTKPGRLPRPPVLILEEPRTAYGVLPPLSRSCSAKA